MPRLWRRTDNRLRLYFEITLRLASVTAVHSLVCRFLISCFCVALISWWQWSCQSPWSRLHNPPERCRPPPPPRQHRPRHRLPPPPAWDTWKLFLDSANINPTGAIKCKTMQFIKYAGHILKTRYLLIWLNFKAENTIFILSTQETRTKDNTFAVLCMT